MPKPTPEHVWLEKFVGDWSTDSKGTMGPDQPPMECKGSLNSRKLGGFWVLNEMKGDMAGAPMTGVQTIGYDENKKKYVGTWVDSMTNFMWKYEGTVDKTGKILTLEADGPTSSSLERQPSFKTSTNSRATTRCSSLRKCSVAMVSGLPLCPVSPRRRNEM